ncbi:PAS domain-containing sensor histidine kinase [Oxynema aestuarii]|uniref:histidine kinase n=1 Tax=Oxynema aestuarii AP17 TaxID=2064643 RepID=A0A6H1TZH7_9CYAN|nr:PAS domain S-box protein [Oxynema aestuarii]QIZ70759.1 PAS domain S-box protein [Oxynema aestuarii AP17]
MVSPRANSSLSLSDNSIILWLGDRGSHWKQHQAMLGDRGYTLRAGRLEGERWIVRGRQRTNPIEPIAIVVRGADFEPIWQMLGALVRVASPPENCHIPILIRIGVGEAFDPTLVLEREGVDYLREPFESSDLLVRIERLLQSGSRRRQQTQIEQQWTILERAIAQIGIGVTISDALRADYPIVYVNSVFEQLTGYTFAEVKGQNCRFLQGKKRDQPQIATLRKAIATGEPCEVILENYRKDGTRFWNQVQICPFRDAEGTVTHIVGLQSDASDRRAQEQFFFENRERFRLAFENAPIGMAIASLEPEKKGTLLRANTALCRMLGYSHAELKQLTIERVSHPDDWKIDLDLAYKLLAGDIDRYQIEKRYIHKQGHIVWGNLAVSLVRNEVGEPLYAICHVEDISDRKRAELALQERETQLQILGDNLDRGLIYQLVRDPDGCYRFSYMSGGVERLLGLTPEQVKADPSSLYALIAEEDRPLHDRLTEESWRNLSVFSMQMRKRKPDGSLQWSQLRSVPRRLPDGTTIWDGIEVDITELKLAEAQLRESEERFRGAFDDAAVAMAIVDLQGNFIQVNRALCDLLGYDAEELLKLNVCAIVDPEEHFAAKTLQPLFEGRQSALVQEREYLHKDGEKIATLASISLLKDERGKPRYAIGQIQDIRARKAAEAQLVHAKEAAEAANRAKSAFLANMSHELRTPLHAIFGFSDLLRHSPNLSEIEREHLQIVRRNGENLLGLINEILDLSKIEVGRGLLKLEHFDLYRLLQELEEIFGVKARQKNLGFQTIAAPNLPRYVCSDRLKLTQVLIQLLENAIKFTTHGEVSLEVRPVAGDCPAQTLRERLRFAVRDTGIGIAEENHDRIFEPFTAERVGTKGSTGSGLGLALVRKHLELLDSAIELSSEPENGSTFAFEIEVETISEDVRGTQEAIVDPASPPTASPTAEELQIEKLLADLSASWKQELRKAALVLDDRALFALLDRLSDREAPLVHCLRTWIDNFAYDKIIELLDRHCQDSS